MKTKTIITEITHDDLVNLFSTACYGSQWLSCNYDSPTYHALPNASIDDCLEDKLAKMLLAGKTIELCDYYAEDAEDVYVDGDIPHTWDKEEMCMVYTISLEDVKNGLQKAFDSDNEWERKCAKNLITDDGYNLDQPEAEYLCQMIMFEEQIY